jgi:hypothetical protein
MNPATVQESARLHALALTLRAHARELERERDSRCVFTHAYALMTDRLADALPTSDVQDPGWVTALAHEFAARYETALSNWDAGSGSSAAWRAVFATICARRTSVVEDLVFPMAAHIMRDLPHALVAVGFEGPEHASRIHDFHIVNAVMGDTIAEIQEEVSRRYARYVRWLDRIGRGYDEILTDYGVRLSRGMAWYNAVRLAHPLSATAAAASIERSPAVFVDKVMNPRLRSLQLALRLLRWLLAHLRRWPAESREQPTEGD